MKKVVQKSLAFLLVLTIMIGLIPAIPVFAADRVAEGLTYIVWKLTDINITGYTSQVPANLVIPSTIEGKPVTQILGSSFEGCSKIESVEIPDSVTDIGMLAFGGCPNLKSVKLGRNSMLTTYRGAFYNCKSLTSVDLGGLKTMGPDTFYSCAALESITFPSTLTKIESSAFVLSGLKSVRVPSTVTSLGVSVFSNCKSLETAVIEGNREEIPSGFLVSCSNLKSVTLPGTLKKIGDGAMWLCTSLETVILPDSVEVIEDRAFQEDSKLKNITLPKNLKTIGNLAFYNCKNLTSVKFPNGLETIGNEAFSWCIKLNAVDLPDSVTYVGENAFNSCEAVQSLTISKGLAELKKCAFANCDDGVNLVVVPDAVKTIEDRAIALRGSQTYLIPDSVTSIVLNIVHPIRVGGKFTQVHNTIITPSGSETDTVFKGQDVYVDALINKNFVLIKDKAMLPEEAIAMQKGGKITVNPVILAGALKSQPMVWESSNRAVATVANGVVTATGGGEATITATVNGETEQFNVAVTVPPAPPAPRKIPAKAIRIISPTASQSKAYVVKGKTITLGKVISPSNTTDAFKWSSGNTKIATVSSSGVVKTKKTGSVYIYARAGSVVKKILIKVVSKSSSAKKINIASSKTIYIGKSAVRITPTISKSSSTSRLTWSSSNKSIVKVDKAGYVIGLKKGTCYITVKTSNGKKDKCKVTVK